MQRITQAILLAPLLTGAEATHVTRRAKLLHLRELYTQACNRLGDFGD